MLLRHAEAAPLQAGGDLERPLADAGRAAAQALGVYLKQEQLFPDLVLVSPALRTRETWDAIVNSLDAPVRRETRPSVRALLVIGHNPGTADLARRLVSHGDRYAAARMAKGYPPAGLAVIDFALEDWGDVTVASGRLDRFVTPGSLGLGPDA
jgi:phosphohistidine phosphatase